MPFSRIYIRNASLVEHGGDSGVLHVSAPHALVQAAGYLKYIHAKDSSEGIYFRGQRKQYGSLSPTAFRGIGSPKGAGDRQGKVNKACGHFENNAKIFAKFFDYTHEPLLQHYGIRTTWIDIVDNVWVALWFGCHRAISSGRYSEYLHFERRKPSDGEEYVYILLIGADISSRNRDKPGYFWGDDTELIDLRMSVPSVFVRPHAQHGLLFRLKGKQYEGRPTDYSSRVRGVIRVSLADALDWLGDGHMIGVHSLFPPPSYDDGYRMLLECNYFSRTIGSICHIGS